MTVSRALISVSDKTGVVEFARALTELGIEVLSSGGTAATLQDEGVPVTRVADVTGAHEILGGRVKTLHPRIHGGILADRARPEHMQQVAEMGIALIDLVVCNLYPFEETAGRPDVTDAEAAEQIDIGGPAMVRAAAKNWAGVTVVVSPSRYPEVLAQIRESGGVDAASRRALALEAFAHTAAYDAAIVSYLAGSPFSADNLVLAFNKEMDLRYGENPHQQAAFYRDRGLRRGLAAAEQLHGKELSYNNLLDADAARRLAAELPGSGAVIVKHSNPCGVAVAPSVSEAYRRALECDETSAFGGIVALNQECDRAAAEAIAEIFTEVVIAPGFTGDALDVLTHKKNLRLLSVPAAPVEDIEIRRVSGGILVQSADPFDDGSEGKVVTKIEPDDAMWRDLKLAWVVVKHVKSNAIVFVKEGAAVGVGAGQMSRVEAVELAAKRAGGRAAGAVVGSDAFFPFRDGVDAAAGAGAVAVIQPGGSVRDEEVIAAADEHGMAMVLTGRRHFRH